MRLALAFLGTAAMVIGGCMPMGAPKPDGNVGTDSPDLSGIVGGTLRAVRKAINSGSHDGKAPKEPADYTRSVERIELYTLGN